MCSQVPVKRGAETSGAGNLACRRKNLQKAELRPVGLLWYTLTGAAIVRPTHPSGSAPELSAGSYGKREMLLPPCHDAPALLTKE